MSAENSLESRVVCLESFFQHLAQDVAEIKVDIRRLDDKIDTVRDSIASAKIWALLLYFVQSATLLGVMAHGFGWLK